MLKRCSSFDEMETGLQVVIQEQSRQAIYSMELHIAWISLPIKYFYFYHTNLQSTRSRANRHENVNRGGYPMGRIEIRKQKKEKEE